MNKISILKAHLTGDRSWLELSALSPKIVEVEVYDSKMNGIDYYRTIIVNGIHLNEFHEYNEGIKYIVDTCEAYNPTTSMHLIKTYIIISDDRWTIVI